MGIREVNMKINNLHNIMDHRVLSPKEEIELHNLKRLRNQMYNHQYLKDLKDTLVKFYTPDEFIIESMVYTPGWYNFYKFENLFYFESKEQVSSKQFKGIPNREPVSNPNGGLVRWWSDVEMRDAKLDEILNGLDINSIKVEWYC